MLYTNSATDLNVGMNLNILYLNVLQNILESIVSQASLFVQR